MKRLFLLLLTTIILFSSLPLTALNSWAQEELNAALQDAEKCNFQGKTVSILSHSASTYAGVSNNTADNSTIGNNDVYYTEGRHGVYQKDTWWQQAIDVLGMRLLVNNSWSGSCVFQPRKGEASVGYGDRAVNLHNDHTGEEPDVIWVYLGCNDFAYYKDTFGTAEAVDYSTLITDCGDETFAYAQPQTTCEAYAIMLHKVQNRYKDAEIYCMTSTARRDPDYEDNYPDAGQPTAYSAELQKVAERLGFPIIDLESCIPKEAESFDLYMGDKRAHPNALGMDRITNEVLTVMLGKQAEICHLTSGGGVVKEQAVLLGSSYSTTVSVPTGYTVSVIMDGKDVSEQVCSGGSILIEEVTGDIEIELKREAKNFRWELQNDVFDSVNEDGFFENKLTLLEGSISGGNFSGVKYALAEDVRLCHDKPWMIEWACTGNWDATLFANATVGGVRGVEFLFRSGTEFGLLAIGEHDGTRYNNYGIPTKELNMDMTQRHVYRLENRVSDGGNMVWLYIDGVEIGAMNNHYIGSKNDTGNTSDWISGRDFIFGYMGTVVRPINNCSLEYVSVQEDARTLSYDDHLDVSGKTVEIVDAGTPTSYKVGYGVAEQTPDDAVITLQGETLIATGIGEAKVRIDGTLYRFTVNPAPISMLLLIGQSNMRGSEGNANQSIVCPDGMVYATYGDDRGADNVAMTEANATQFAPSALTGEYSNINVEGTTDCLSGYPVYSLTQAGVGKIGPDSGFAYEWVKQTGEKVWIVNAAHGGSSINTWQKTGANYLEAIALFSACQETLRKEIAAGHYTLSHMGYFWCQGCSDRTQTAQWYVQKYLAMHENLKTNLAFDHDSDAQTKEIAFEFGGIIPVRVGSTATCYRDGTYSVSNPYAYHESFVDLRMNGPRVAQYWMINNPELTDIWGVCNIGESWVWMPDGTNGVSDYFNAHYPGGTVDYQTQVAQKASWYTPTTPAAVHDSIHYNQIGYNEVGRESVRNALIMLGELDAPETETTVKFLTWDGYTEAKEITASVGSNSSTLVVPAVSPIYNSKKVTYEISDGLTWSYYDLLAESPQSMGTVTALGESVTVVKSAPGSHFAEHLSQLPQQICCGLNLWTLLEHDEYYYASGTGWGIYSTGEVCSVTIPINPGDRIFATSLGAYGTNGHSSTSGIRTTFFSDYGVAKTMKPAEAYAEFVANGGYLVAPEGAIAVNVAMWNDSDSNELYILNMSHAETEGICTICGTQEHTHSFTIWKTVSEPDHNGPGKEIRTCTGCGETQTRDIMGVWQNCGLTEHFQELPAAFCSKTNLWTLLTHDKYFYSGGTHWAVHSSGTVYSVTIPVQPGDRIYATAFGKAGENGHASSNGIRVTFFDAYGVAKTLSPAETYAEFSANGYLTAPEGAVAVNIPMWTNSDGNELYIQNKAHAYQNGKCIACGDVTFTYGDANGDGSIDGRDVTRLLRYIANYDEETSASAIEISLGADANGDGNINGKDVTRLLRYIANYDEETGASTVPLGPDA